VLGRTERSSSGLWSRLVDRSSLHAHAATGLDAFLQAELLGLSKEAGKKFAPVKEV